MRPCLSMEQPETHLSDCLLQACRGTLFALLGIAAHTCTHKAVLSGDETTATYTQAKYTQETHSTATAPCRELRTHNIIQAERQRPQQHRQLAVPHSNWEASIPLQARVRAMCAAVQQNIDVMSLAGVILEPCSAMQAGSRIGGQHGTAQRNIGSSSTESKSSQANKPARKVAFFFVTRVQPTGPAGSMAEPSHACLLLGPIPTLPHPRPHTHCALGVPLHRASCRASKRAHTCANVAGPESNPKHGHLRQALCTVPWTSKACKPIAHTRSKHTKSPHTKTQPAQAVPLRTNHTHCQHQLPPNRDQAIRKPTHPQPAAALSDVGPTQAAHTVMQRELKYRTPCQQKQMSTLQCLQLL